MSVNRLQSTNHQPQKSQSGCFILLLIFLVGFGGCVSLVIGGNFFVSVVAKKENEFIRSIDSKITSNTAKPVETWLYANMIRNPKSRTYISLHLVDQSQINKQYISYLEKAVKQQNNEAKLQLAYEIYIATFYASELLQFSSQNNYTLNDAFDMVDSVLKVSCKTHYNMSGPQYPSFHNYQKTNAPVIFPYPNRWFYSVFEKIDTDEKYFKYKKSLYHFSMTLLFATDKCGGVKTYFSRYSGSSVSKQKVIFDYALAKIVNKSSYLKLIEQDISNSAYNFSEINEKADKLLSDYYQTYIQ